MINIQTGHLNLPCGISEGVISLFLAWIPLYIISHLMACRKFSWSASFVRREASERTAGVTGKGGIWRIKLPDAESAFWDR
jgi:hypothetical protein